MDKLGIRFNDCVFGEPVPLSQWTPPGCAGLYALLVADPNWAPKPFQPLFFGDFGNHATAALIAKERSLLAAAPPEEALFVCAFPMPFSTSAQRWLLRNELIRAYNPPCCIPSADAPPATELVRKLDELERRHQEETAELRLLFASAHDYFTPRLHPRRRIGFIPLSQTVA
jgi:hypothetical protein